MKLPKYSIIIPVFNRPDEVDELLESLSLQTQKNFEVIIVEDGSTIRCEHVLEKYQSVFPINYLYKTNEGPGPARNLGFQHARGEYFVAFDSDCIIPKHYFEAIEKELAKSGVDAWGGPDRAHADFTILQRAMGYTMSSVFTTGGIRGGKNRMGWFQPRSFNMGISRKVFEITAGFKFHRFAEDIEFSIRMKREGFKVGLIHEAYVYHKRRTSFSQFFHQVYNFGKGRAQIGKVYPDEVSVTHWLPSLFTFGFVFLVILYFLPLNLFMITCSLFVLYFSAIFIHSLMATKSFLVAIVSVPAAIIQLTGYGLGFFIEWLKNSFNKLDVVPLK